MTEPRTRAGLDFVADWAPVDLVDDDDDREDRDALIERIVAIEAEAAKLEREALSTPA